MAMAGAANEMINGGTKCLKDKYGPECRLDARMYINPVNTLTVYELRINTLGVAPLGGRRPDGARKRGCRSYRAHGQL